MSQVLFRPFASSIMQLAFTSFQYRTASARECGSCHKRYVTTFVASEATQEASSTYWVTTARDFTIGKYGEINSGYLSLEIALQGIFRWSVTPTAFAAYWQEQNITAPQDLVRSHD